MIFHVYAGPKEFHCPWCVKAKELLERKEKLYNYHRVTETVSREEFAELFTSKGLVVPRTVPQIFVDIGGTMHYIGTYTDLQTALEPM
ncbi:glutaredoxin 1 [compost metagenome]